MRVRTGLAIPGSVLRPDFSRGSAPPVSPRHHDDYRAELEHGRIGRARADRSALRESRPMSLASWTLLLVTVAVVILAVAR